MPKKDSLQRQTRVGVLVGSLRRGSYSRKVAKALMARAPEGMECEFIEIGTLPLYNQDLDGKPPAEWQTFRDDIRRCDALIFVTPEYNRSMPGCLKNATDIGSRPEGENAFAGLPAAVVSVSPYSQGGFGANHALRQNFVYLDLAVMQQPEAYIGDAKHLMDGTGRITNGKTHALLTQFMEAFGEWAAKVAKPQEPFGEFLKRREVISLDYINGKADSLLAISTNQPSATFFPPSGAIVRGASKVNAANTKGAGSFGKGSKGHFRVLQSAAPGTLGFWTGMQHAEVRMPGKSKPVRMNLRVTEVFRVEGGAWKLVHRHADMPEHKA